MFDGKDGQIFPMSDMSDGYRTMVAIIGDIACKAALLNPHLNENSIEETPGVVLIDELDQHLHPRWQRRIIEDLRRTFPKIQFICTTHSPFLIQSLGNARLIDLGADKTSSANFSAQSIEDIVESVQNVEMPQRSSRYLAMFKAAEEYFALLRSAQNVNDIELEALKNKLDELSIPFSDDPAFQALLKQERIAAIGASNQ
jgi:predicted ATP-binding protein involved in virulence